MSFELSFSESFYYAEGTDINEQEPSLSYRPTNLYDAIGSLKALSPRDFNTVCLAARIHPKSEYAVAELVEYARYKINTCTDLSSPVKVWLIKSGYISVEVWDIDRD